MTGTRYRLQMRLSQAARLCADPVTIALFAVEAANRLVSRRLLLHPIDVLPQHQLLQSECSSGERTVREQARESGKGAADIRVCAQSCWA